jgi:hypothetical protein
MISFTRDDLKYVACPSDGCTGNLIWISETVIKCDRCAFQEEMKDTR